MLELDQVLTKLKPLLKTDLPEGESQKQEDEGILHRQRCHIYAVQCKMRVNIHSSKGLLNILIERLWNDIHEMLQNGLLC